MSEKRPRRPRIQQEVKKERYEDTYDDLNQDYTTHLSGEDRESELIKEQERIKDALEYEAASRAYDKMKERTAEIMHDEKLGYSFAFDVKKNLKSIYDSSEKHKFLAEKIAILNADYIQIEYAEETDDFSQLKSRNVNRGNTEEWKYKIDASIAYAKGQIHSLWGGINLMKNTLFIYYFLINHVNGIGVLHKIYEILKEGMATSHYTIKSKDNRTSEEIRKFNKSENEVAKAINRVAYELKRIADKVDAVSQDNIEEMMSMARHDEIEEAVTYFYSVTSPENEQKIQEQEREQRKGGREI